jgi:hypothetical protein
MTKDDIIRMAREAGFADGVAEIVGLEGFANFFADTKKALEAALEQPEQEPVAWICYGAPGKRDIDFEESDINELPIGTHLYTTPTAQRPWQGLTDEDVNRESAPIAQQMKLAFHAGMYVAQKILQERNT